MSSDLALVTPGLPATIATAIRFTTRPTYGADGQFEGTVVDGATLIGQHPEALMRAALTALESASRPGGFQLATIELSKLRAKTAFRSAEGGDQHLIGQAYAEELAGFPQDVIREACRRLAASSRWWPAWADLKCECDRLVAKRRAEHRALKAALDRLRVRPAPALAAPTPLPTLEERLRTSVVLRRQAGDDRTAARHELKLAEIEKRAPAQWAQDTIAAQLAEQRARAEEFQRAADAEKAKSKPASESDAYLAEKAQARRDARLGIKHEGNDGEPHRDGGARAGRGGAT
jgi:hypothetical protein